MIIQQLKYNTKTDIKQTYRKGDRLVREETGTRPEDLGAMGTG
jgi:hypothetical protein